MVNEVGLFFDFDGTLSPLNVRRDEAGIRKELTDVLMKLSSSYTLVVVSSKDCYFLMSKAPFFHSYICVNGLEILTNNYILLDPSLTRKHLVDAVNNVKTLASKMLEVYVEEKRSLTKALLGLSVEWVEINKAPEGLDEVITAARGGGLTVIEYSLNPFIDIYISNKNKGDAVKALKSLLELGEVIYVGDSENDIPAFKVCDRAVLVRHKYNEGLTADVDHEVPYEELHRWLMNEL
ncbi:MAG: HAD-IIB family hydrolase [Sulfolobales archaeon]|nr:HAD-IIB family hydrolase [Sulfolobales archaeon]